MQKRTKFKSRLLDLFMIAACLSVAGYFAWTFWKDLNSSAGRNDKEKIATITFKNRIAQRKFDDRVVWERIDKSTPLYNGDLVRTADLAEAVITFNDNSQINIYENTMIQIYYSESDGIQINLDNGNLQLDTSDNSKVAMKFDDGSVVNVKGGTSLAAKTTVNSEEKSIEVKNGNASITNDTGDSAELSGGETVSLQASGEIKKKAVTVTSIPQEMHLVNFEGGLLPVKLEWNLARNLFDENVPVIVQTSKTKDFSKIIDEKIVNKDDSILNVSDGVVYWRVFPKNHIEDASVGKISVEKTKPVQLLSPLEESEFSYKNKKPVINFRWSGADYAEKFMISISSSKDMSDPVYTAVTENRFTEVDTLGSGKWWWQVTPYYTKNSIGYSGDAIVSSFTINRSESIKAPDLILPNDHSLVSYKDNPSVNLIWKSDIKNADYQVFLASDPEFNKIIYYNTSKITKLNVKLPSNSLPQNGEIYWKVLRNSNESNDLNPESNVHSFTLQKYVPEKTKLLYPPENYNAELTKLLSTQFMWKTGENDFGKDSVIQVSSSADFNNIKLERIIKQNFFDNMMLPEGEWWWRVGLVNSNGQKENFTEARRFVILEELKAPRFTGLTNGQELIVAKEKPVVLSWTNVKAADYYNVRVFDSANHLVTENDKVKGNSVKFNLAGNSYTCRIQAVAEQTEESPLRTGPVKAINFSVRNPSPVITTYPAESQRLDGLSLLRKPLNFTWKDGFDKAASYEFVLKKRQVDGSLKIVESAKTTRPSYSISRLSSGSYTWQILANTKSGIPLDSASSSFIVTAIDSLQNAVLLSPAHNQIMDSAYLRSNRTINFEWKPVEGASEYSFVLYKKERNGSLTAVYSEKNIHGTKIRFKNLSSLDVGDFTWNVTAYSFAKDGFEERRSGASSGSFKIKFDSPSKIETVKPGKLYGE